MVVLFMTKSIFPIFFIVAVVATIMTFVFLKFEVRLFLYNHLLTLFTCKDNFCFCDAIVR